MIILMVSKSLFWEIFQNKACNEVVYVQFIFEWVCRWKICHQFTEHSFFVRLLRWKNEEFLHPFMRDLVIVVYQVDAVKQIQGIKSYFQLMFDIKDLPTNKNS